MESEDEKALIDAQSNLLIDNFFSHLNKYLAEEPAADPRKVFESWAIQKIAGLQVLCSDLFNRIKELEKT